MRDRQCPGMFWIFGVNGGANVTAKTSIHIYIYIYTHMGVSKNSGAPKWMVYNGNPY